MSEFRYVGPVSGVAIRRAGGTEDVLLHPGATVALPADHPYVVTLLARHHLAPVPAPSQPAEKES